MANVRKVERVGGDILVRLDDGRNILCASTGGTIWYPVNGGGYGPDPGDPDPEGDGFMSPFPWTSVSSEYGPRSGRIHQGIDFANVGTAEAFPGADILAAAGGTVIRAETGHSNQDGSGFGNVVIINHGVINDRQLFTVYAHLVAPGALVGVGDVVAKGDLLGRVGNTGNSFGEHLHWETHVAMPGGSISWANPGTHINPRDFMSAYGTAA